MENNLILNKTKKIIEAFETICKPYCQKIGLSFQAFEILIFISKHQGIATAQDICKQQSIKPTLISFHIDKLVQMGYIERENIEGNRRSIKLVCTDKAKPIIEKGIELYEKFHTLMWKNISEEEIIQLKNIYEKISKNVDNILSGDF